MLSTNMSNYNYDYYSNISYLFKINDYDGNNLDSEYILLYLTMIIKIVLIFNIFFLCKRIFNLFKLRKKTLEKNKNKKRKIITEKYVSNKRAKLDISCKKVKKVKCYFCDETIINNNKKSICNLCDNKFYVVKKIIYDISNIILKEDRSAKKIELIKSKIFRLKKIKFFCL